MKTQKTEKTEKPKKTKKEPKPVKDDTNRRKWKREASEKTRLSHRLSRIEGQIRGIKGMIEDDCHCMDIMTQVSASQAALASFSRELLNDHIRTCMNADERAGRDAAAEELVEMLKPIMR